MLSQEYQNFADPRANRLALRHGEATKPRSEDVKARGRRMIRAPLCFSRFKSYKGIAGALVSFQQAPPTT